MNTEVQKFYDTFQPPKGFKVPDGFPIPRNNGVVIKKRDRSEYLRKSGVILMETEKSIIPNEGTIYAVGPKVTDLKPGMRVIFNFYANCTIVHDEIIYLTMDQLEVYCALPNEEDTVGIINHKTEGRKQLSYDELPDRNLTKEDKQEIQENATMRAEEIKHENTTTTFPVNITKD